MMNGVCVCKWEDVRGGGVAASGWSRRGAAGGGRCTNAAGAAEAAAQACRLAGGCQPPTRHTYTKLSLRTSPARLQHGHEEVAVQQMPAQRQRRAAVLNS